MSEMFNFHDKVSQSRQTAERIPKFVGIIYQMIEDPRYQDYVSWSQDGCALLIKRPTEFAEYVLPIFFKHSNFSSFVRQLNLYSFRKKKHYPFENAFVHGMFKRGQKGLLIYLKRKGNEKYSHCIQESEPNFFHNSHESDPAYDELSRQNTYLKKIHQDLTEHVQNIEEKVANLSRSNEVLQTKYQKKTQEEELLKNVLKKISKIHGEDSIKKAYQAVIQQKQNLLSNSFDFDSISDTVLFSKNSSVSTTISDTCIQDALGLKTCTNCRGLCDVEMRNPSSVAELFKMSNVGYDARFDSERSTPTNDKRNYTSESSEERTPDELKQNLAYPILGFQNGINLEQSVCLNQDGPQDLYFDGNYGMLDNGFCNL